jgi:hypothetical protein
VDRRKLMRQIALALTAVAVLGLAASAAHAQGHGHASSHRTVITLRHPAPHHGYYYGGHPGHDGVYPHGYYLGVRPTYYYAPYPRVYRSYGCYGYPYYGYSSYGSYYRPYGGFHYYGPRVGFSIGF